MTTNEESIYDEEVTEVAAGSDDELTDASETAEIPEEEFKAIISTKSPKQIKEEQKERGIKLIVADNSIYTIKRTSTTKPKLKDKEGNKLKPKTSESGVSYYPVKLRLNYVEDDMVEVYPGCCHFVKDGIVNPKVSINRKGNARVSFMFRDFVCAMSKGKFAQVEAELDQKKVFIIPAKDEVEFWDFADNYSDAQFFDWLVAKKVQLKPSKGNYKGQSWFRNDIVKFVL